MHEKGQMNLKHLLRNTLLQKHREGFLEYADVFASDEIWFAPVMNPQDRKMSCPAKWIQQLTDTVEVDIAKTIETLP